MSCYKWMVNDTSENRVVPAFGHPEHGCVQKVRHSHRKGKSFGEAKPMRRERISVRTEHTCFYCGCTEGKWTIEHLVPRRWNGFNNLENLVRACCDCNHRRGCGLNLVAIMKDHPRREANLALAADAIRQLNVISMRKYGYPANT